ncbi:hypothetical protein ALHIDCOG_00035 [Klebsiella phage CPRSB]|nr:hypothetical protein ALHIDCOG_00035 [Klebsiella phage CPRSB]
MNKEYIRKVANAIHATTIDFLEGFIILSTLKRWIVGKPNCLKVSMNSFRKRLSAGLSDRKS